MLFVFFMFVNITGYTGIQYWYLYFCLSGSKQTNKNLDTSIVYQYNR